MHHNLQGLWAPWLKLCRVDGRRPGWLIDPRELFTVDEESDVRDPTRVLWTHGEVKGTVMSRVGLRCLDDDGGGRVVHNHLASLNPCVLGKSIDAHRDGDWAIGSGGGIPAG